MKISDRKDNYLFGGDGDLVGFLLGFLADKPHHLLDLLGDICVVHFAGDLEMESEKIGNEVSSSSPIGNEEK